MCSCFCITRLCRFLVFTVAVYKKASCVTVLQMVAYQVGARAEAFEAHPVAAFDVHPSKERYHHCVQLVFCAIDLCFVVVVVVSSVLFVKKIQLEMQTMVLWEESQG